MDCIDETAMISPAKEQPDSLKESIEWPINISKKSISIRHTIWSHTGKEPVGCPLEEIETDDGI